MTPNNQFQLIIDVGANYFNALGQTQTWHEAILQLIDQWPKNWRVQIEDDSALIADPTVWYPLDNVDTRVDARDFNSIADRLWATGHNGYKGHLEDMSVQEFNQALENYRRAQRQGYESVCQDRENSFASCRSFIKKVRQHEENRNRAETAAATTSPTGAEDREIINLTADPSGGRAQSPIMVEDESPPAESSLFHHASIMAQLFTNAPAAPASGIAEASEAAAVTDFDATQTPVIDPGIGPSTSAGEQESKENAELDELLDELIPQTPADEDQSRVGSGQHLPIATFQHSPFPEQQDPVDYSEETRDMNDIFGIGQENDLSGVDVDQPLLGEQPSQSAGQPDSVDYSQAQAWMEELGFPPPEDQETVDWDQFLPSEDPQHEGEH
jgi:hypothetical protein